MNSRRFQTPPVVGQPLPLACAAELSEDGEIFDSDDDDLPSVRQILASLKRAIEVIDLTCNDDGDSEDDNGNHTEVSCLRYSRTARYHVTLISPPLDRPLPGHRPTPFPPYRPLCQTHLYTQPTTSQHRLYSGHAWWEETTLKMCVELFFLCYGGSADCVLSYFRTSDLCHGNCRRYLHLRRYFTQNIDCIETKLPPLSPDEKSGKGSFPATWQLHGWIDQMICQFCKQYLQFNPKLFHGYKMPLCFHARSRYRKHA